LLDVACTPEGACEALDAAGRWSFAAATPGERTPWSGIADLPDLYAPPAASEPGPGELDQDHQAEMFARQLSAATRDSGRIGFYRLVIAPDGGRIALIPGNGATLMRTGHGIKAVRLGLQDAQQPWPATLALHPTGRELYILAWPDGVLRALAPETFEPHWTLALEAPAHGLYIDSTGRYLIGQLTDLDADAPEARGVRPGLPGGQAAIPEGASEARAAQPGGMAGSGSKSEPPADNEGGDRPAASLNRIAPWPEPDGATDDAVLRERDAPPATGTFVIDLGTKSVAAALPGRLRRSIGLTGGLLVATSEALQFIPTPPEPQ
jgi:hypothetical protein